jgi:hypothetical protein
MEFWSGQMRFAECQIAEIENKISLQQEVAQDLRGRGADDSQQLRMIAVLQQNLKRANSFAEFIAQRLAAEQNDGKLAVSPQPIPPSNQPAPVGSAVKAAAPIPFEPPESAKDVVPKSKPAETSNAGLSKAVPLKDQKAGVDLERFGAEMVAAAIAMSRNGFNPS